MNLKSELSLIKGLERVLDTIHIFKYKINLNFKFILYLNLNFIIRKYKINLRSIWNSLSLYKIVYVNK
jgi:hypothetical protein